MVLKYYLERENAQKTLYYTRKTIQIQKDTE